MDKRELVKIEAAAAMAILPKDQITQVCIALATALTGAMVIDLQREGKPTPAPENIDSHIAAFILAAIKETTGLSVTALKVDADGAPEGESESKATPEAQSAAERAMQDVLKRMKDGGSVH